MKQTTSLQFTGDVPMWAALGISCGVALFVFWLYRREINTCPLPVKMVLAGLRLAVLLSLVALFLKPSIFYQQVNEVKPTITFLRDASLSFARSVANCELERYLDYLGCP